LQALFFRRQRDCPFEFRDRFLKLARLDQHLPKTRMSVLVQRRDFDLFAERGFGVCVVLLLPVNATQQSVSIVFERIDLCLFVQNYDCFVKLSLLC
jgi:hypothetical protein